MNVVADFLARAATLRPDKVALVDGEVSLTYRELEDAVHRVSSGMRALGLEPGDRVAYHGNNRWELVVTLFAAIHGGFVVLPLNVMLRPSELEHIVGVAAPRLVLTTAEGEDIARSVQAHAGFTLSSYDDPEGLFASWLRNGAEGHPPAHRRPDHPVALFFTSGTTGKPKGAPIDHEFVSHLAEAWIMAARYTAEDRYLVTTPMFWTVAPVHCILPIVLAGGSIVLMRRFDLDECFDAIKRHAITTFFGVPTIYTMLVDRIGERLREITSLRVCPVAGSGVLPDVIERFESLTGATVLNAYGATEAGLISREMLGVQRKRGCAGTLGGTLSVRIVGPDGQAVPPGTPGEVLAKGYTTIKGYWRDGKVDPETLPDDGWLRTGDIAVLEDGLYLRILDRVKDMIITGGANIYSAEVEQVIARYPGVRQCALIGVPDRVMGELPVAYVVASPEAEVTPQGLEAHCRDQLSRYKIPRRFELIESLPVTPTGKVQKTELRRLATESLEASSPRKA